MGAVNESKKELFLNEVDFVEDLLSGIDLGIYNTLGFPNNVFILNSALKQKLKETPDYEVWTPFKYYRLAVRGVVKGSLLLTPDDLYISNKGNIRSFRNKTRKSDGFLCAGGYLKFSYRDGSFNNRIAVHRALACCFIPVTDALIGTPMTRLEVNHVDGVKFNLDLNNLEWTTPLGNMHHAHATGLIAAKSGAENKLTKPIKLSPLSGKLKGVGYLFSGKKEMVSFGITPRSIYKAVASGKPYKGCSVTLAMDGEQLQKPNDEFIAYLEGEIFV